MIERGAEQAILELSGSSADRQLNRSRSEEREDERRIPATTSASETPHAESSSLEGDRVVVERGKQSTVSDSISTVPPSEATWRADSEESKSIASTVDTPNTDFGIEPYLEVFFAPPNSPSRGVGVGSSAYRAAAGGRAVTFNPAHARLLPQIAAARQRPGTFSSASASASAPTSSLPDATGGNAPLFRVVNPEKDSPFHFQSSNNTIAGVPFSATYPFPDYFRGSNLTGARGHELNSFGDLNSDNILDKIAHLREEMRNMSVNMLQMQRALLASQQILEELSIGKFITLF